jgi:hypothetical protein
MRPVEFRNGKQASGHGEKVPRWLPLAQCVPVMGQ